MVSSTYTITTFYFFRYARKILDLQNDKWCNCRHKAYNTVTFGRIAMTQKCRLLKWKFICFKIKTLWVDVSSRDLVSHHSQCKCCTFLCDPLFCSSSSYPTCCVVTLKLGNFLKFDVHRAVQRNIISIIKSTRCTNVSNFFLFCNGTLHVSDGLSVHHQEFTTVHTAIGVCQTDTAVC